MECHRCPHAVDVKAGRYRNVAFKKTPCSACKLVEKAGFDMEFHELDSEGGGSEARTPDLHTSDRQVPISVLVTVLREIFELPAGVRDVICCRMIGWSYLEIATAQGVTVGAVENRHRRAMKRSAILRALFTEKAAKQKRRVRRGSANEALGGVIRQADSAAEGSPQGVPASSFATESSPAGSV